MAFRDEINYIERMTPARVELSAEDCARAVRVLGTVLPGLPDLRRRVDWVGTGRPLFDERLKEIDRLLEGLRNGYDKVGKAYGVHARDLKRAQGLVEDGIGAEARLRREIQELFDGLGDIGWILGTAQPMRIWETIRASEELATWFRQHGLGARFEQAKVDADRLFGEAGHNYDRAREIEQESRAVLTTALDHALRDLPEFQTDATQVRIVLDRTPGLAELVQQGGSLPDAHRTGPQLRANQVADSLEPKPTGLLGGYIKTAEEERLLRSRGPAGVQVLLYALDARTLADSRFPLTGADDGHNDAFRHAYWSARVAQEFGEDFAERYGTAHEAERLNAPDREAMDLHNNALGRAIGVAHPNATPGEVAGLVEEAIRDGRAVVVNSQRELDFSDRVRPGDTGRAQPPSLRQMR
ncbi:DUF6973 domain-containing protein [Plantactinospora endophytica]|uniref:DUF6973 domain-containing protein n=1 Tax=Plantactinospora endophytica TaxID=673535 RepID=A0ABQ4E436_9ACTN|nr:hypothetical protein [Plantactinospora endophytica]GIG89468.1 hypothetical protein Pen02_44040 [Plantactinospora endophytica]